MVSLAVLKRDNVAVHKSVVAGVLFNAPLLAGEFINRDAKGTRNRSRLLLFLLLNKRLFGRKIPPAFSQ